MISKFFFATSARCLRLAAVLLPSAAVPATAVALWLGAPAIYVGAAALLAALCALVGLVIAAAVLSRMLTRAVANPLAELEQAVRDFSLDRAPELPPVTDELREIAALRQALMDKANDLRATGRRLRVSLRQGEKVRAGLIDIVTRREKEITSLRTELEHARFEDPLTGLANRRRFAEFLDRAWRGSMRTDQPVSLVLIDVDRFRTFNEIYGQAVGDNCLRAVADAVRPLAARGTDLLARFGDAEFMLVLGNMPLEGALSVGESIRHAVAKLEIPHDGATADRRVTVSVGLASAVPSRGSRPEAQLLAADRALTRARENGGDTVAYSTAARTGVFQNLCLPDGAASRPS